MPVLSFKAAPQTVPLHAVPRVFSQRVLHRASQAVAQRFYALGQRFGVGSHPASLPATLQEKGAGSFGDGEPAQTAAPLDFTVQGEQLSPTSHYFYSTGSDFFS